MSSNEENINIKEEESESELTGENKDIPEQVQEQERVEEQKQEQSTPKSDTEEQKEDQKQKEETRFAGLNLEEKKEKLNYLRQRRSMLSNEFHQLLEERSEKRKLRDEKNELVKRLFQESRSGKETKSMKKCKLENK